MKRINLFLILILFIFLSQSSAISMDFYPELGTDPFYSSLNPTNNDKAEEEDNYSVISMFKNKKKTTKADKELKKQKKLSEIAEKKDSDKNSENNNKNFLIFKKDNNSSVQKKEEKLKPKRRPTVRELEADERAREKEKEIAEHGKQTLKQKFMSIFPQKTPKHEDVPQDPKIELSADHMEYYPDQFEVQAIGNAKIVFTKENTKLIANKIIYDYDKNIIKANENVFLMTKDSITEGDFVRIDLSKPDGWIENPITTTDAIKLEAKEAYVYSDKVEEYDGVAKILKNEILSFRADSFGSYVDQSGVLSQRNYSLMKPVSGVYSLKAKTIYIDSRKDHDIITVKNADIYVRNHKIATIPSARIVSNKNNTVIESNIPEIGSQSMLGMHVGPAVVLNIPGGSTLKLAPILTYGNSRLGFGGIARFRNEYNMTEVAYGTSESELLVRGRQKILPGLTLNYSRFTNQSEWFLGYRRPKYAASLNYARSDYVKDLRLTFAQEFSAGAFLDDREGIKLRDSEGRFRWMTQTYKPMYIYKNDEGSVSINAGLVAQTSAAVYTSGDVYGLFRFGPALSTSVGPWKQSVVYYMTGIAGKTPFEFDRYRYGRSNVLLIESLRICKYLSVGYLASLAMNRDVHDDGLFQENRVLLSVGPDYMKLTFGYDVYRHNTSLLLSMLVGSQNSEVAFKKTVIKNPDTLGKTNNKKEKPKKKNYKRFLKEKITPDTVL